MTGSARRTATRWALLCLLFLGVVGMHHVTAGADVPGGHAVMSLAAGSHGEHTPDEPEPAPSHDALHLCMAVLGAAASLLLLGWLLLRAARPATNEPTATPPWPRTPDGPPPLGGRGLLSSLCVLRL
ncbi:hypothetical protein ACIRG5_20990 [Lentzea sp. NPDC102401]|uniref:hypothetical protein n=1 Tax=Lentzea sp. NPDC102401 TaxID=3364128 RepID=UPI003824083D